MIAPQHPKKPMTKITAPTTMIKIDSDFNMTVSPSVYDSWSPCLCNRIDPTLMNANPPSCKIKGSSDKKKM